MLTVAKINEKGLWRAGNSAVGMTFIVDKFTPDQYGGHVAHVRDYRYPGDHFPYQIWSIPADGYDIILPAPCVGPAMCQAAHRPERKARCFDTCGFRFMEAEA